MKCRNKYCPCNVQGDCNGIVMKTIYVVYKMMDQKKKILIGLEITIVKTKEELLDL